jgi:hypothetical protein
MISTVTQVHDSHSKMHHPRVEGLQLAMSGRKQHAARGQGQGGGAGMNGHLLTAWNAPGLCALHANTLASCLPLTQYHDRPGAARRHHRTEGPDVVFLLLCLFMLRADQYRQ